MYRVPELPCHSVWMPSRWVDSLNRNLNRALTFRQTSFLAEHLISWIMLLFSLPLCALVLWKCRDTNYDVERVVHVEDLEKAALHGAALPKGHHTADVNAVMTTENTEEKRDVGAAPTATL